MSVHTQRSCIPVTDTSGTFALCYLLYLQSAKDTELHKSHMELMNHLHSMKLGNSILARSKAWMATGYKLKSSNLFSLNNIASSKGWQELNFESYLLLDISFNRLCLFTVLFNRLFPIRDTFFKLRKKAITVLTEASNSILGISVYFVEGVLF